MARGRGASPQGWAGSLLGAPWPGGPAPLLCHQALAGCPAPLPSRVGCPWTVSRRWRSPRVHPGMDGVIHKARLLKGTQQCVLGEEGEPLTSALLAVASALSQPGQACSRRSSCLALVCVHCKVPPKEGPEESQDRLVC